MRAASFDPAKGLPAVAPDLLQPSSLAAAESVDSAGRVHFILQFAGGVDNDLVGAFASRGISYERYLPDGGMIASAALGRVPRVASDLGARALLPLVPAFKVDPALWSTALSPPEETLRLSVLTFDTPRSLSVLAERASVLAFDGRMAIVDAPAAGLLALARAGDVEWVESYAPPRPAMDLAAVTLGARQAADGPFHADGRSVWSYNASNDSFEGLTGRGVIVNVADTGIDETHPAFDGRIVAAFGAAPLYPNATCDCYGFPHGTHVAGIVAGNGSWRAADENRTDGKYAGVAPEAGLIAQLIFGNPRTTSQLSAEVAAAGAYINSNSWGGGSGAPYTSTSQAYDELVTDANGRDAGSPQMVYVFAAGNSGPGPQTTDSPGTAKNVITVGATGDDRGSSSNSVAGFSSRGPTADGRLKPDVVAPGAAVISARAQSAGCAGDEGGCSYWALSGTSMSTPAAAGAAALVTEWYQLTRGALPTPAMVKAALIASATPLPGYLWPDNNQGWGRVNVSRAVNEHASFRHIAFDESTRLSTTGRTNITYRLFAGSDEELRVVLVWSDVAGTTSSSKALINDLDLEVVGPDGKTLLGNAFQAGYSVSGTTHDTGNNTEVVRLRAPTRGVYSITVRAVTVPSGDQVFALVAQGNVTDRWVTLEPAPAQFLPAAPREADPLTVVVPVVNTGTVGSGPLDVTATITGPEGNATETVHLLGVMYGDDLPAVFHFQPARGPHTVRVVVDPGGTSGDELPLDNARQDTVFVRGFEVDLEVLSAPTNVTPLGSSSFVLRVVNRGNVQDQVNVTATGPSGWPLALNLSSSFIGPGEAALVSGAVAAPERALAGTNASFNFTAVSGGNASRVGSLDVAVGVDPFVSLRLTPDTYSSWVDPGGGVSFNFLAENAGNVELDLSLDVNLDAGAGPGWGAQASPPTIRIAPYANATASVDVVAPPGAGAAEVRTITLRPASPQVASLPPVSFQVFVTRLRDISLAVDRTQALLESGASQTFNGTVTNRGNAREYVSLLLTQQPGGVEGMLWSASPTTLWVEPGGSAGFDVTVSALPGGQAGASVAALRVVAEGTEPIEQDLTAVVAERHALSVSAPAGIRLLQGTAYSAGVTVTNEGNVEESVSLDVTGAPSGVRLEGVAGTFSLAPGESHLVKARLVADGSAAPGNATLRVVARGVAPGASAEAELVVSVDAAGSASPATLPGAGAVAALAAAVGAAALGARRRGR
jgi:subtilisin family serine protease/uncharacterized membrane protein